VDAEEVLDLLRQALELTHDAANNTTDWWHHDVWAAYNAIQEALAVVESGPPSEENA
jgi:hypothetical protein